MSGRVLHLGQVVVDFTLSIAELPEKGGDVFADDCVFTPGGGYNVIYAAWRMGSPAVYHGALGAGPFGDLARRALDSIEAQIAGPTIAGMDTGICIVLTEPDGERTFVSTRGAEMLAPPEAFTSIEVRDDDVVYLSGYSFCHEANTRALENFADAHRGRATRILADVGPMIGSFTDANFETIRSVAPLWSLNEREARILGRRFGLDAEPEELVARLGTRLGSPVVLRAGARGAWFTDGGSTSFVPTPKVTPVDTNGAGDAHSGVLCAAWAQGLPMPEALLLANCAGALSTLTRGPATCPERAEIEAAAKRLGGTTRP